MKDGKHSRRNLADYFAIVGVGDNLTWKHKQKQHQQHNDAEPTNTADDEEAERERFYREIVDISIISRPSDALITSVASHDSEFSSVSSHKAPSSAQSPSHSDATTVTTQQHPAMTRRETTTTYQPDGWTVVNQTLPSQASVQVPDGNGALMDLWKAGSTFDANIEWSQGLGSHIRSSYEVAVDQVSSTSASSRSASLRKKVQTTLRHLHNHLAVVRQKSPSPPLDPPKLYLAYRRRQDHGVPAVADVRLLYVRLHRRVLPEPQDQTPASPASPLAGLANQVFERYHLKSPKCSDTEGMNLVNLRDFLTLPESFQEWSIPSEFQWIRDPSTVSKLPVSDPNPQRTMTVLLDSQSSQRASSPTSGVGVEAVETLSDATSASCVNDPMMMYPEIVENISPVSREVDLPLLYIPVIAIRRQRLGDEERYHEDPAVVDLSLSFLQTSGEVMLPMDDVDEFDETEDEGTFRVLGMTRWCFESQKGAQLTVRKPFKHAIGMPVLIARRNTPFGFADAAFATKVQGRFPLRNYKGLPLPEEELPMFCYPTGCRLFRAKLHECPVAQYYGFVVKNERGDSIYISCVSFMEPLTPEKVAQLDEMSVQRMGTSLPNRKWCEKNGVHGVVQKALSATHRAPTKENTGSLVFTSYDDVLTFENKTICLVSRFPFWTAFRKFLLHIHLIAGTASQLPLERYISHLLLSVPLPSPGGRSILIPLVSLSEPMILSMPAEKDFPLVDLPYKRLFSCLDVKTVITVVLSLLALERKLIVVSSMPSLVLDVCELLRSLLFPFELCAPYVPRLTEPFKSSLDFPGAIFVGIHDDGSETGLASLVRTSCPEDSVLIDLDTGDIDCDGDRVEVIARAWQIVPSVLRTTLVSELEALCRDAGIVDGQEPLDSQFDSSFDVALSSAAEGAGIGHPDEYEPFDDRAVRDAFLRFFCAVLGGYERFLVVPDADFLVSGNEWFDAQGYLASVPEDRAPYLNSLVSTQLFQSFVQRRTEASDVHCLLFDESLAEFHASSVPYGRLGGDLQQIEEPGRSRPLVLYGLLVDQCVTSANAQDTSSVISINRSFDTNDELVDHISNLSVSGGESIPHMDSSMNVDGDLITKPTPLGLPEGKKYTYCVRGNPCFPYHFGPDLFLPKEPDSWLVEMARSNGPLLARNGREIEEANRRRRLATSNRVMQTQCLWQLPKIMGSHFLGAWLLCIPSQVSQSHLVHEQQSRFLMRALGALRLLRSKQRIVPDEAAYRALMVACGRSKSDRRVELVKVFGLLRSDGIFPSAVTLGQYTKALAEGYSKRSYGKEDEMTEVELTESGSRVGRFSVVSLGQRAGTETEAFLGSLDPHLASLEEQGRRWRQRSSSANQKSDETEKGKKHSRIWHPVSCTTSLAPSANKVHMHEVRLTAMWSRTKACSSCSYIPLEEEIQAGWATVSDLPGGIECPRCTNMIIPALGYQEMSISEALAESIDYETTPNMVADFGQLPPQVGPSLSKQGQPQTVKHVAYTSPISLRTALERYINEYTEDVIERERLKEFDAEIYYNFVWYCARFALPVPLPIAPTEDGKLVHHCIFVAWDKVTARRGCLSAAKVLYPVLGTEPFHAIPTVPSDALSEEWNFLSRFNLQAFYSNVWDHDDMSKILVTLVEACDKRDFRPVVESVVQANRRRRAKFDPLSEEGSVVESDVNEAVENATVSDASTLMPSVELDLYKTVMYLSKYQCTTAFHAFFPATMKACKGYHNWCRTRTPLPMFDRLLRDAVQRFNRNRENNVIVHVQTPSEVALAFRCVFGHLI